MIETSFIVIAHNEERNIERTLRSISAQRGLADYEMIVVDDGSADGTSAVTSRYSSRDPAVRVITLSENRGRGHARAVGVERATGRLIATVDADIVLPDDWYLRCRAELESADAVSGTAIPDGDVTYLHSRFRLHPRTVSHSQQVTGSNALFRAELFARVQFDRSLSEGEDVAVNHAMRAAAARMRTVDGLLVRHEEDKDLRTSLRWLWQSGIGASRQFRRYRELRRPDVVSAGWFVSMVVSIAVPRRLPLGLRVGLPLLYVSAASAAHVRSKFFLRRASPLAVAGAIALDAALLTSYFAGRVAGLARR